MKKDAMRLDTELVIEIKDTAGRVLDRMVTKNTLTNAGFAVAAGLYGGVDSQDPFTYLALSTNATTPAAGDNSLASEITGSGLARAQATVSRVTTTVSDDTTQLYKEWTASGTVTVEKVGFFNAASGGVMGGSALTGSKSMLSGQILAITYKIKHGSIA